MANESVESSSVCKSRVPVTCGQGVSQSSFNLGHVIFTYIDNSIFLKKSINDIRHYFLGQVSLSPINLSWSIYGAILHTLELAQVLRSLATRAIFRHATCRKNHINMFSSSKIHRNFHQLQDNFTAKEQSDKSAN